MIVEAISCFLCSATLFWALWSGEYLYFVTPKMKNYLYFAVVVFFIWGVFEVVNGKRRVYKRKFDSYYLLLAISAFLMIACKHSSVRVSNSLESVETMAIGESRVDDLPLEGLNTKEKKIVVSSENFLAWINELRVNSHAYEGYAITIEGNMGVKKEENKKQDFYLIRWYMSCCAADVIPVGVLCEWGDRVTMEEEAFVRVEGKICCSHSKDGECTKILVSAVSRIAEPKEKYIYS